MFKGGIKAKFKYRILHFTFMETTREQLQRRELNRLTEKILKEFIEGIDSRFRPYGQMSIKSYQEEIRDSNKNVVEVEKGLIFRVWQGLFSRKDAFVVIIKFNSGREYYLGPCKQILVRYSKNFEDAFPRLRTALDRLNRTEKLKRDIAVALDWLKNKLNCPKLEVLNE
jgi:hypothetical protein